MKHTFCVMLRALWMLSLTGCATYDLPYVESVPEHAGRQTALPTPEKPISAKPVREQSSATNAPPPKVNTTPRGNSIPQGSAVDVEPLPPPPASVDTYKPGPRELDARRPTAPEKRVADFQRIFELGDGDNSTAQLADASPVRPGVRPPAKGIPYWSREYDGPDEGDTTPQETAESNNGSREETPAFITWPSPVRLPPITERLWLKYRAFEFSAVIALAMETVARTEDDPFAYATACTLAAASAYLVDDTRQARSFLARSVVACPATRPDPRIFTSGFCSMYRDTARQLEERRGIR